LNSLRKEQSQKVFLEVFGQLPISKKSGSIFCISTKPSAQARWPNLNSYLGIIPRGLRRATNPRGLRRAVKRKIVMRKRSLESEVAVMCPYCGDVGMVPVDEGGGPSQEYFEDCPTCCKPRSVRFHANENDVSVELLRE
jgi:hypothetical protein